MDHDLFVLIWYYTMIGMPVFQSINLCFQHYARKGIIASPVLTLCTIDAPECFRIITHLAASICISVVVDVIILRFSHVEEPFSFIHDSSNSSNPEQSFIF